MNSKPIITLATSLHKGKDIIFVKFDYNKELINCVKQINGAKWSQTKKSWDILKSDSDLHIIFDALKNLAHIDYSSLKRKNITKPIVLPKKKTLKLEVKLPDAYYDILDQKRYSKSTKSAYINYFEDFLIYFIKQPLNDISTEQINKYLLELIQESKNSDSQQNQCINAKNSIMKK